MILAIVTFQMLRNLAITILANDRKTILKLGVLFYPTFFSDFLEINEKIKYSNKNFYKIINCHLLTNFFQVLSKFMHVHILPHFGKFLKKLLYLFIFSNLL